MIGSPGRNDFWTAHDQAAQWSTSEMEDSSEKGMQKVMHMRHMHISIIMLAMIANFFMVPISLPFITYLFDRWIIAPFTHFVNR